MPGIDPSKIFDKYPDREVPDDGSGTYDVPEREPDIADLLAVNLSLAETDTDLVGLVREEALRIVAAYFPLMKVVPGDSGRTNMNAAPRPSVEIKVGEMNSLLKAVGKLGWARIRCYARGDAPSVSSYMWDVIVPTWEWNGTPTMLFDPRSTWTGPSKQWLGFVPARTDSVPIQNPNRFATDKGGTGISSTAGLSPSNFHVYRSSKFALGRPDKKKKFDPFWQVNHTPSVEFCTAFVNEWPAVLKELHAKSLEIAERHNAAIDKHRAGPFYKAIESSQRRLRLESTQRASGDVDGAETKQLDPSRGSGSQLN